ncbi:MAG: hypothetical protein PHV82_02585, partial [Victivallaceae bacterium]|nr:hypothetical protein [Victivallaceae bacterium]
SLVPTIPEEYEKLGSYALIGLPDEYAKRYVAESEMKTDYPIIVGGKNFGCGSSREHAPISLGAAGCKAVIANSFARIFFRNCIATGEVYPVETDTELNREIKTGDEIEIDLDHKTVKVIANGKNCKTKDLGAVKAVIEAGGIFDYARNSGMIGKK